MKVNELREKLSKLKKVEVIKIASEFYKLIPKAKKEDYDLDSYINDPTKRQKKSSTKKALALEEMKAAINEFIDDASEQYYLVPNRKVPKKERATWRFKVKRWYKELTNTKRADKDLAKQAKLLSDLYELLCESCGYNYFSAYDTFQSIGIEQSDFYKNVIELLQESNGKLDTVKQSIELIVDNYLNRFTLYSTLMREFISTLHSVDLKYKGIEVTEELLKLINYNPNEKNETGIWSHSHERYQRERKNNNLAELGLRLYFSLYETDEGIEFYHKHYHYNIQEVKLYVLITLLFEFEMKDEIVKEIDKAIENGIQPRNNLMKLKKEIEKNNKLPKYMW